MTSFKHKSLDERESRICIRKNLKKLDSECELSFAFNQMSVKYTKYCENAEERIFDIFRCIFKN